MSAARSAETRTVLAQATRLGARYRRTWPLAIIIVPSILAATALNVAQTRFFATMVAADGTYIDDRVRFDEFLNLSIVMFSAYGIAVVAWSFWIALVVANVPALTARWPPHGPIGAFFAPFIPFIGFKRPHSVVRGVLSILTAGRAGPLLIALAWWIFALASYFAPSVVILMRGAELGSLGAAAFALEFRLALLVPAAILAIAVVVIIEREQRVALKRRATAAMSD